ncbi:MAG: ATP-binding protein [Actinomycetota bacterium]|nr:ATP-binding protein [Acidimicrobiia bacterium]MDQ3469647.1 ATP-binding protein [Actinomycetota bacterium]
MQARLNPYSPGAGVRPVELAGREAEIEAFDVIRHRALAGRSAQSIVLYGLRGVGKTVLLNEMADRADAEGWLTARIEAHLSGERMPFRRQIAQSLNTALRHAQGRSPKSGRLRAALATFKAFSLTASPDGGLTVGLEVEPQRGRGDTGSLPADLTDLAIDLADAAADLDAGVTVFIDEMQHLALDELAAVCQACHEASQRRSRFFVVGAGLPNLPGLLSEAKSYAERLFTYVRVDRLEPRAARAALTLPALEEGVEWVEAAADVALAASGGYPYFIQQYGQTTWNAAVSSPITVHDAQEGIRAGRDLLDHGFFRARWERATRSEREYLAAMAVDGHGPSSTGEVASRLGRQITALGPTRAKLIAKGLVFSPEHGQIGFSVPGMADFIARELERS